MKNNNGFALHRSKKYLQIKKTNKQIYKITIKILSASRSSFFQIKHFFSITRTESLLRFSFVHGIVIQFKLWPIQLHVCCLPMLVLELSYPKRSPSFLDLVYKFLLNSFRSGLALPPQLRVMDRHWGFIYVNLQFHKEFIIEVRGVRSNVKTIRIGCVQGSVLGPCLFSIYCRNLHKNDKVLVTYAYDTYVIVWGESH